MTSNNLTVFRLEEEGHRGAPFPFNTPGCFPKPLKPSWNGAVNYVSTSWDWCQTKDQRKHKPIFGNKNKENHLILTRYHWVCSSQAACQHVVASCLQLLVIQAPVSASFWCINRPNWFSKSQDLWSSAHPTLHCQKNDRFAFCNALCGGWKVGRHTRLELTPWKRVLTEPDCNSQILSTVLRSFSSVLDESCSLCIALYPRWSTLKNQSYQMHKWHWHYVRHNKLVGNMKKIKGTHSSADIPRGHFDVPNTSLWAVQSLRSNQTTHFTFQGNPQETIPA